MYKIFGKKPIGKRLELIKKSPNYKNGSFQNISHTPTLSSDGSFFKILKQNFKKPADVTPKLVIPSVKTNLNLLGSNQLNVVWFGHSSYLLKYKNITVLVDPVFNAASPVPVFGKAFKGSDTYQISDMPDIDILVLTHDHYDHLDYLAIKKLHPNVKTIITSLGVGQHLIYWGVPNEKINELDWEQTIITTDKIKVTATSARHFSGRGIKRAQTLWSSFILNFYDLKIYIGGDSGYDKHFKEIGERYGSFDLAFLECGQYGKYWPHIHMTPEETVKAAIDIQAKILFPVHWAKFALSVHPWNEPIKRLLSACKLQNQTVVTPQIGEKFILGNDFNSNEWWNI